MYPHCIPDFHTKKVSNKIGGDLDYITTMNIKGTSQPSLVGRHHGIRVHLILFNRIPSKIPYVCHFMYTRLGEPYNCIYIYIYLFQIPSKTHVVCHFITVNAPCLLVSSLWARGYLCLRRWFFGFRTSLSGRGERAGSCGWLRWLRENQEVAKVAMGKNIDVYYSYNDVLNMYYTL